jgi:hypothetical protein
MGRGGSILINPCRTIAAPSPLMCGRYFGPKSPIHNRLKFSNFV